MTRRLNLGLPVRCAKCGQKFTRTHGREKLCPGCKRSDAKARSAVAEHAAALAEVAGWESEAGIPRALTGWPNRVVDLASGTCQPR